jgi:hypothetical protein
MWAVTFNGSIDITTILEARTWDSPDPWSDDGDGDDDDDDDDGYYIIDNW